MKHSRIAGNFTFHEAPRNALGEWRDALAQMLAQQLDGLIVRGVFDPAAMAKVAARLDQAPMPRVNFDKLGSHALGYAIVGANTDLVQYFEDGDAQRQRIRDLFADVGDFEGTVSAVLSELAGGVPVAVAHGFDGRSCPSATLRVIREGGEIGIHVDNAYLHMPHTEHLRALVDPVGQLSYFLTLAVPDDGGSIEVIGLEWAAARLFMGQPAGEQANVWYRGSDVWNALEGFGYTGVRPEPGDLLVFDGGRYFHRVSTVHGARPRCTIGGFLGMTTGRDRVYIWS